MGRQVIDIRKDGEKVYVKNHAKVTFLSDGTNVEQRIIDVSNDLSTKVNKDYIDGILENIIVDSSQIDFNQLQNNPFIDNNSGELEVMDESGNIIAKIDAEGIHSVDFIAGEHRLSDKTDKTYVDEAIKNVKVDLTGYATEEYVNNIDFYNIKDNPIVNNGDGKLLFVDENGYIGLQLEEDGLYIKDVIADGHTLSQKANKSDLPTKLSDLDNDTNYITLADIPPVNIPSLDEYITEEELNSKGYITQHQDISHLATKAEVSDIDFYNIKNNPVINSETGKLLFVDESGNIGLQLENNGLYVSNVFAGPHVLSNKADKSEVPTSTSQLTNDSGYITKPVVDQAIASLVDSAPETLDTIGEIASALKNNAGIVDVLNQSISNKQNTIEDLDAIRAGATKGASALQEIPEEYAKKEDIPSLDGYATQAWVNNKNYATEEDLSSIEFNSLQNNPLVEDSNGEFNLVDDLGNVGFKVNEEGLFVKDVIAGNHVLSNKQDTLVSGTNVKTINGTSILGSGDITISSGNPNANVQAVTYNFDNWMNESTRRAGRDAIDLTTGEKIYFTGHADYIQYGGGMLIDYINDKAAAARILKWDVEAGPEVNESHEVLEWIFTQNGILILNGGIATLVYDEASGEPCIQSSIVKDGVIIATKVFSPAFGSMSEEVTIDSYPISGGGVSGGTIDTSNLATKDELAQKQDVISDIDTIRSNAANYKGTVTSVQVNGSSKTPSSGVVNIGNVVTSIKINGQSKSPSSGVVDLGYINKQLSTSTSSSMTLFPNIYYRNTNTSLSTLTITLGIASNSNIINEYFVEFTTRSAGTTVSLPSTIKWANGEAPTFEASTTYQISIVNNLGIVQKFK